MARPIDHSAEFLNPRRTRAGWTVPVPWARIFVAVGYVTATGCAIVLLGLAWRHEVDRRQAAQSTAAMSGAALQTAQEKIGTLADRNETLSARADRLTARLEAARRHSSRRGEALRSTKTVLRGAHGFVAALEGLDESATTLVEGQDRLVTATGALAAHVDSLSRYVSRTREGALDRALLVARLEATVRDLATVRAILARMEADKAALGAAADPLARATDLDAALRSAIARAKGASSR